MRQLFTVIFMLLLSCLPVVLKGETITWYHADFPPGSISKGPDKGKGYNDQTEKFMVKHLPEFQHQFVTANYSRIVHDLKVRNGCTVGLFKSKKREKFILYSIPRLLVLPNGVVFKKDRLVDFTPYIDENEYISIDKLIGKSHFNVGVAKGRNYAGGIQQALEKYKGKKTIIERVGLDVFSGLFQMLMADHLDYIIGFPVEAKFFARKHGYENAIRFLPVKEMPLYSKTYMACSKNKWGYEVIDKINQILTKHRHTPEYLSFYEYWLDDAAALRHKQFSHKLFLNQ
ncbi:TIGR02285 family protein [Spartinivicinus poritis]